jgi:hypothetical protein
MGVLGSDGGRVLVAMPTERDAEVTSRLLWEAGFRNVVCDDLSTLSDAIGAGGGALLLTEEVLTMDE